MRRNIILATCLVILTSTFNTAYGGNVTARAYARWTNGPPHDASFFPIAVWMQNPRKAEKYRDAGFNTYVALWKGPTEEQLAELKMAGMKVICRQNEVVLKHIDDPTIIGWMHGDEPDNAQSLGEGKSYGPPILPKKIIGDYQKMRSADPTRPVFLTLGHGVAWDDSACTALRARVPWKSRTNWPRAGELALPLVCKRPLWCNWCGIASGRGMCIFTESTRKTQTDFLV